MKEDRNCEWCGQPFTITNGKKNAKKYCCDDCARKANNVRRRIVYAKKKGQKDFARSQMKDIETGRLDETLKEARSKGLTYAELQKQKTLALYGGFNNEH